MSTDRLRVSVIIPALNERAAIGGLLQALQGLRTQGHQVVLVDGGSVDDTPGLAAPYCDRVVVTGRGRARQMNAGARVADGDLLWFLHADTGLPPAAVASLLRHVDATGARWGACAVRLDGRGAAYRVIESMINLRSWLNRMPTGDQGIFVSGECFAQLGGFADLPLMEDLDLCRRLRARCAQTRRATRVPLALQTSARRWRRHGMLRTVLLMWGLRLAWYLGVQPARLAAHYRQCSGPTAGS